MRTIETEGAPTHKGPVPQAVEVDGWVFVSALFGIDPKTGELPDTAEAEAEQLFANLERHLARRGWRAHRCGPGRHLHHAPAA